MAIPAVSRRLLSDQAHEALRAAIVDGTISPGTPLRDGALAEQLGLSRGPVREAIKRLVAEGLVESKPQSYTRVAPLDHRDAADACAVVRAMHELATRAAVAHLAPDDVAAMESANRAFAAAVRVHDIDAALAADDELHGVLVRACGNRALAATVERYTPMVRRAERRLFAGDDAARSVDLHDDLIGRCRDGDAVAATAVTAQIYAALERQLRHHA